MSFKNRVGFDSRRRRIFSRLQFGSSLSCESAVVDVAAQYLEARVGRAVKDGDVMLLENIAHLRLGEIDNCCRGLAELLRRRSENSWRTRDAPPAGL